MRCSYDPSSDELLLSFVEPHHLGQKEHELETDVIALINAHNWITAIRFTHASQTICKINSPH
jgi:uncharacterized protein YuzE